MYFCGPTVYQRIHIGNARPFVLSMWFKRWLERSGYRVKLAENVTDINDKIYEPRGPSASAVPSSPGGPPAGTSRNGRPGPGRPDVEPLASETVGEIVALTQELISRGLAYESGGDVYFRVARFPEYGRLSGARPEEMAAQEPGQIKEDARDFALWKGRKPQEDTWWDSPWGRGRPGWHIECSAMAEKHLGAGFDVHGGGLDLRFPHHENELAQSRGAGRPFARTWMHNGMIELGAEKMSKSIGNIVSLREALDRWGREAILVFFLGGHYRSPLEYSDVTMQAARAQADDFRQAFRVAAARPSELTWDSFADALDDDFDTPRALAVLHGWRAAGQLDSSRGASPCSGSRSIGLRTPRRPDAQARRGPTSRADSPGLCRGRPAPGRDRPARMGSAGRRRRLPPHPKGQ